MKVLSQMPGSKKGVFLPAFSLAVLYLSTGSKLFLDLTFLYAISSAAFHAFISEMEGMLESVDKEGLERGQAESQAYSKMIYKGESSSYRWNTFSVLLAALPMVFLYPYSTWLLFENLGNTANYLNSLIYGFFIIQLIWTAELIFYLVISQKASKGVKEIASEAYEKKIQGDWHD